MSILIILKLVGALALLIYGMKVMSEALQKMAGSQLRHILGAMTTNRITGMLTGTFITTAVQSSTATTVMTVSFVNAGLLTLAQAISVIMGANIGTTFTAWIMSAGFSFNMTSVVWPVFLVAIILIYTKRYRYVGDFLFGVSFMFFSLGILSMTGKEMDLAHNEALIKFFASFNPDSYLTIIIFVLIGTILIPNPAAKITAFCGLDLTSSSSAFAVMLLSALKYPSSLSLTIAPFTLPIEALLVLATSLCVAPILLFKVFRTSSSIVDSFVFISYLAIYCELVYL